MAHPARSSFMQLPMHHAGRVLVGAQLLFLLNCAQSTSTGGPGSGGAVTGGNPGAGGLTSSGGTSGGPNGGTGGGAGGATVTGGSPGSGGSFATGGTRAGTGGGQGSGGAIASGGTSAAGGATVPPATGGGGGGLGGATNAGGATGSGGASGRDAGVDAGSGDARNDQAIRDGGGTGGGGTGGSTMAGTGGAGGGGAGGSGLDGGTANLTVWLAGDSTVANGSTPCPVGWGKQFQALFNSRVTVTNSAQGGRSVQTWLYDVSTTMGTNGECVLNSTTYLSAWTTMLNGMKAGDYLFIQFGINDGDSTCNRHVGTALFQTYYGMMAQAAKDRGANPIFVTPVSSISCSGAKAVGSRGTYAAATKQAGTTYAVPVIDLEQLSVALYNSLAFCPLPGADTATTFESGAIGDFFCEDHTHFEAAGATQIAGLVAKALRDQGMGLASYLK